MSLLSVHDIVALDARTKPAFHVPWRGALQQYAPLYTMASRPTRLVTPCMIASIVERETGGQNIFQIGMPHGPDCGVGLTQITYGVDWTHPDAPTYPGYHGSLMDPLTNLTVAAVSFLEPLARRFPGNHVAMFDAYNDSPDDVARLVAAGRDPDADTTGGDYGSSVFTSYVNFVAASTGNNVDWSSWHAQFPR